jgi:16S rRNA (uracil1498-N3)-methyltransferase
MNLPYFYEPDISIQTTHFTLSEETSKHCIQVLRMKEQEALNLTDGKGNLFTAVIASAHKKNCTVNIVQHSFTEKNARQVSVAISLVKNNTRFEWFLEKATECGITEIIPLLCHRTERQHFRFDRMNNILISAMLQSQQTWLPVLQEPTAFDKIATSSTYQQKLIAHCLEEEKKSIKELSLQNNIQILIGPEGDFTKEEIQSALQQNFKPVSLGNTRLRTETAGIMAAFLLKNL